MADRGIQTEPPIIQQQMITVILEGNKQTKDLAILLYYSKLCFCHLVYLGLEAEILDLSGRLVTSDLMQGDNVS